MALHAPSVALRSGRMALACGAGLMLLSGPAAAALTNLALLDTVVDKFSRQAHTWQGVMMNAATWLFWTLGTISLVWTGGMLVLRKADTAEFFAEFIRFILFFGFFLWLLRNGPAFATSIIASMQMLGANATGQPSITPSTIVDVGFKIWQQAVGNITALNPVESLVGVLLSAAILLMLAAVAVNMLLLLVSGWILMYAGIFFLGFGGSRWTSDMAINYYKTVLGVGVQLMTMVLLVGIGNDLLADFYSQFNRTEINLNEMVVMVVFCLVLLMLVTKVPAMVAGMVTGGAGAAGDMGSFGAGAVMGAAMGAAGAASAAAGMAGAAMRAGAANAAGGAQALMAAYSQAAGAGAGDTPDTGGGANSAAGASAFAEMDAGQGAGSGRAGTGEGTGGAGSDDGAAEGGDRGENGESSSGGRSADGASQGRGRNEGDNASNARASDEGAGGGATDEQVNGAARDDSESTPPLDLQHQGADGFSRALATAAGTASHLAQGSLTVGKQKLASLRSQARQRIDATVGARIAAAIQRPEAPPTDGRAGGRTQRAAEIAAFVQRDSSKG